MDYIYIHDLKIATTIGAYAWEQKIKQTIYMDLEISVAAGMVAQSDDLTTTFNYAAIAQRLTDYLLEHRCNLLETLAENTWQLLVEEFKINWLKLKIRKPGILPNAKEVGIVIERNRK